MSVQVQMIKSCATEVEDLYMYDEVPSSEKKRLELPHLGSVYCQAFTPSLASFVMQVSRKC